MSKPLRNKLDARPPARRADQSAATKSAPTSATRETVESIVIAFVLAFLFRTFEAEAFVIPTGSMAPTLMGMHKDVVCPKCGYRYRVSASEEGDESDRLNAEIGQKQAEIFALKAARNISEADREREISQRNNDIQVGVARIRNLQIVGGVCPICRYVMPMTSDLPRALLEQDSHIADQTTYNGDRILVNKYCYTLSDPKRFDVVVFHFPGDAEINYIKRLVGLPNETLRVFQGDLLVGPNSGERDDDFKIVRKPPDKCLAVRQLVHDTDHDPASLYAAGWPLRWYAAAPTGDDGWKTDPTPESEIVRQRFTVDRTAGGEAWLRYHHYVPNEDVWQLVNAPADPAAAAQLSATLKQLARPELIMDFNAYNTRISRRELQNRLQPDQLKMGIHWVGDLMVEADVQIEETKGELLIDLVEAGKHFTCSIDLATGVATLGIDGVADFAPKATTPLSAPGKYRVVFANVDQQLILWATKTNWRTETFNLTPDLMKFDRETTYDGTAVFGARAIGPKTNLSKPGDLDLAPAGIGARGSKLAVTRLQVWRDIYYIADRYFPNGSDLNRRRPPISDWDRTDPFTLDRLPYDPQLWDDFFLHRRHVDFPLGADQYFVMGDNSAESSDARLWQEPRYTENNLPAGWPGGAYLERRMLIGKAVWVYWPHHWYSIPIKRIPLWPNWRDMRLVR